jgi:hypothetical protein
VYPHAPATQAGTACAMPGSGQIAQAAPQYAGLASSKQAPAQA